MKKWIIVLLVCILIIAAVVVIYRHYTKEETPIMIARNSEIEIFTDNDDELILEIWPNGELDKEKLLKIGEEKVGCCSDDNIYYELKLKPENGKAVVDLEGNFSLSTLNKGFEIRETYMENADGGIPTVQIDLRKDSKQTMKIDYR